MEEFDLSGREFVALCDLMKLLSMAPSGGTAKMLIADGNVSVDGQVELRKRCKIRPGQVVSYESRQVTVI